MTATKTLILLLISALLFGCGRSGTPEERETKQHPLWQTQLDALQKAKEVEGMVQEHAAQRRRQIDEIEQK